MKAYDALLVSFGFLALAATEIASGGGAPAVTLTSEALTDSPETGEAVRFLATTSGGLPPYTYEWDLDGDGFTDRTSSAASIEVTFPRSGPSMVGVEVRDASGQRATSSETLTVRGPRLLIEPEGPFFGPAVLNPGDRSLTQFVRATNVGNAPQPATQAMFVPAPIPVSSGPAASGYVSTTSAIGFCDYGWIDLVTGPFAVAALETTATDGNALGPFDDARSAALSLHLRPVLYDQHYAQAVMSTNGYVSFDVRDTGAANSASCDAGLGTDNHGPQLRPYFDDLIVASDASQPIPGGGLRYHYFDVCPRVAADRDNYPCHVFSWTGMQRSNATEAGTLFDFQAIVYLGREEIAYQYRGVPPEGGSGPTIGIVNANGDETFNESCAVPDPVAAESAICIFRNHAVIEDSPTEVMRQSLVSVPELAVGESVQLPVIFDIDMRARCGQTIAINYLGSTWMDVQSFDPQLVVERQVADTCVVPSPGPIGGPPIGPGPFARHTGLYFNPLRPGNGLFNYFRSVASIPGQTSTRIEQYAGAWYTSLADRTPVWYTLEGELVEGTGELVVRKFRNTAAPSGFEPVHQIVGRAWMSRVDAERVVFAWQLNDGSNGIETMQSGTTPISGPNHTQSWFSPAEPGWGVAIDTIPSGTPLEFIGAFIFDDSGAPRWVIGDIDSVTGGEVDLIGFRPHCPACPWILDWTSDGVPAGTLGLDYQDQTNGTLETSISLPSSYSGSWTRDGLHIRPIATPTSPSN